MKNTTKTNTIPQARVRDMTVGNPLTHILLFAIPLFIGNLFQQIYSMVDTMVAGYNLGDSAIAAIGATQTLYSLFLNVASGQNNGFAIVVTQRFGAHDRDGLKKSIAGMMILNAAIGIGLTVITLVFLNPFLHFMNVEKGYFDQSYRYMFFLCAGLLATIGYNMFAAILRALGNSLTALIFLIISSVLNIGLDLLFVVVFHMDVEGAALATVIAQLVSAGLSGIYCLTRYRDYMPKRGDFHVSRETYKNLLGSGIGMALMYCVIDLGSVFFQRATNYLGELYTTAYTAARRIIVMFMIPCGTIATANATFVGQNWGARKPKRIKETLLKAFGLEVIWAVFVCTLIYIFGDALIRLTTGTDNPKVVEYAVLSMRFHFPFYAPLGILLCLRMAMQSMGAKAFPIISSTIELALKIVSAFALIPQFGFIATCCTEPAIWVCCSIFLVTSYLLLRRRIFAKIAPQESELTTSE